MFALNRLPVQVCLARQLKEKRRGTIGDIEKIIHLTKKIPKQSIFYHKDQLGGAAHILIQEMTSCKQR